MDNTKDDNYYVSKITTDMVFVREHMKNIGPKDFGKNEILQNAMMFRLIQISENAKKLSEEFKMAHRNIPWIEVYGLRNRIVHEYGQVDMQVVYDTLMYDIPEVLENLKKVSR